MAITIRQLRDNLQTLLKPLLGEYTLPNGIKTPAVTVRADSEGLAAGTKVTGLELVLNRHFIQDPVRQYLHESAQDTWEIWLLAWGSDALINEAAARVIDQYPGTTAQVISLPEAWGPARQVKLELLQPQEYALHWLEVDGGDFKTGRALVLDPAILDGGNFFDGSTRDTYQKPANGGVIT